MLKISQDQWGEKYSKMYSNDSACNNDDDHLAQHVANNIKEEVLYESRVQNMRISPTKVLDDA